MNKQIFTLVRKMVSMLYLTERDNTMSSKIILFQNGDEIEGICKVINGRHQLLVYTSNTIIYCLFIQNELKFL